MQSLFFYIQQPRGVIAVLVWKFFWWLPDSAYLRLLYKIKTGKCLNLTRPQTFTEKIQWLKLYNRKPEYTRMVDKYAVKDYVASIIGADYIIPTFDVWDKPEDIDFESLPNQFVLKTTHGGGGRGVVVCRDKASFDKNVALHQLKKAMKQNIYKALREWPYKNVYPRIIAEKYIAPISNTNDLVDYKWYCFNGEPKYCQVIQNRKTIETIDFFDTEWKHQEFLGLNPVAGHAAVSPDCPNNLPVQLEIASKLSKNIPFCRIDLYEDGYKVYFGEITLYPNSGFGCFSPQEWNMILGSYIHLKS